MVLSNLDRELLNDCLAGNDEAWRGFCDRFMGLIVHSVGHVAQAFRIRLDDATRDDMVAEVFLALLDKDFAVLRRFRGDSSLASYLAVVSRRITMRRLAQRKLRGSGTSIDSISSDRPGSPLADSGELLDWNAPETFRGLSEEEAAAVRMFHLEGKSYREIGMHLGLAENSIGPFLSRARDKLRRRA